MDNARENNRVSDEKRPPSPALSSVYSIATTVDTNMSSVRSRSPAPSYHTSDSHRTIRPSSPVPSYHTTQNGADTKYSMSGDGQPHENDRATASALLTNRSNASSVQTNSASTTSSRRSFRSTVTTFIGDTARAEAEFAAKSARNARKELRKARQEMETLAKRSRRSRTSIDQEAIGDEDSNEAATSEP